MVNCCLCPAQTLAEYAFTINLELGLLIVEGAMPEQVENRFHQMIQAEVLVKIDS